MLKMDTALMVRKFRGCLVGSLVGDCLGAPYEGDERISKIQLQRYFDKLTGPYFKAPFKMYTDDTAMTRSVANSLLTGRGIETHDLAKRFTMEYFNDPRRGYGANVIEVFRKLRNQKFEDPFGPAQEQFGGAGSYGNGGAMRVAPVSLFFHKNLSDVIEMAKLSARITHAHKKGVDGTVLQAVAVHQSLMSDPRERLNTLEFSNNLLQTMEAVEKDEEGLGLDDPTPYQKQLKIVQNLLKVENGPTDEDVQEQLGTNVAALYSVPTAIFCFLRAHTAIPEIKTENPFQRTVQYAISLGGDTDTIASMAGAIAGAFYGDSLVNENLKKHCEASKEIADLGESIFELVSC